MADQLFGQAGLLVLISRVQPLMVLRQVLY